MTKRTLIVGVVFFGIGLLALGKTWSYYGRLLSGSDPQFYYAQSRSIAFEKTLDLTQSLELTPYKGPFVPDENGHLTKPPRRGNRIINKYPIGLSLFEVPLLLFGHMVNKLQDNETERQFPTGYSPGTIAIVAVGLLFYTVVGLLLLQRLLEEYYAFWPALLGVSAAWVGTSLFYYSAIVPFLAHGTAFTLVVAILWQIKQLRNSPKPTLSSASLLAATFGLLFLVRPQQIMLLPITLPFLVQPLTRSTHYLRLILIPLGIFIAICSVQVIANYAQLGSISVNAYAANHEGFDWFHPQFFIVLFSASRGLFWMNPILIVSLASIVLLRPHDWLEYIVLAHGVVQVYVIACWSSPGQGDAFGSRMWIECSPLIAIGVAKLFAKLRTMTLWLGLSIYTGALCWTTALMIMYIRGPFDSETHYEIVRKMITLTVH